jgi:P pilus assembly chaperone PapD
MKNTFPRTLLLTLLHLGLVGAVNPAHAEGRPGFGLNTTRVVMMANERSSGAAVVLNNTDRVYLVQGRVYPADGNTGVPLVKGVSTVTAAGSSGGKVPFMVTPPLQRVDAHGTMPLRILAVPDNQLPQDRESLFFLSAKAIPSQAAPVDKKAPGNAAQDSVADDAPAKGPQITLAMQQFVKLFYRPASLDSRAISHGAVASKLGLSKAGGQLRVTNPTPYFITFTLLNAGGKPVDADALRVMVPPKGSQTYPLPAGVTGGEVEWQIVDEYGLATETERRALN